MSKLIISDKGRAPKLLNMLNDCAQGPVKLIGFNDKRKTTGVWAKLQFADGQVGFVESGHLASLHNDGILSLFTTEKVVAGEEAEWREDVVLGIKDGELYFTPEAAAPAA